MLPSLLLKKSQVQLVTNDKSLYVYSNSFFCGKTDMKYEISISELTPPNFCLIRQKQKRNYQKIYFDPKNEE